MKIIEATKKIIGTTNESNFPNIHEKENPARLADNLRIFSRNTIKNPAPTALKNGPNKFTGAGNKSEILAKRKRSEIAIIIFKFVLKKITILENIWLEIESLVIFAIQRIIRNAIMLNNPNKIVLKKLEPLFISDEKRWEYIKFYICFCLSCCINFF